MSARADGLARCAMDPFVVNGRPSETILVPTDGSESARAALEFAIDIASASGERLVLIAVWQELRADFGIPLFELIPDLIDIPRDWAAETLAEAAAKAEARGIETETISCYGKPARVICAVAEKLRPQLIVMGSSGWGPVDGALFGSVSRGVLAHMASPVLLVPGPSRSKRDAVGRARHRELCRSCVRSSPRA